MYTGLPTIVMSLNDNTPTTLLTVTGAVHTGSATGPVVATFGGSNLPLGQQVFALPSELPAAAYYLTATVRDSANNALTMPTLTFTTVAAPAMTVPPASCLGAGCHTNTGHPTGPDCASCHVGGYDHDWGTEGPDCGECHAAHAGPITVTWGCTDCHTPAYPSVPQHTISSVGPDHASGCEGCHATSLITQHATTPAGSVYPNQCDLCHNSADSTVRNAVAAGTATAGTTSCVACHESHTGAHDGISEPICTPCHGSDPVSLHASCATCHPAGGPAPPAGATCTTCHDDLSASHAERRLDASPTRTSSTRSPRPRAATPARPATAPRRPGRHQPPRRLRHHHQQVQGLSRRPPGRGRVLPAARRLPGRRVQLLPHRGVGALHQGRLRPEPRRHRHHQRPHHRRRVHVPDSACASTPRP